MSSRHHRRRAGAGLFATIAALAVGASFLIVPLASGGPDVVRPSPLPPPQAAPEQTEALAMPSEGAAAPTCVGSVNPDLCNINHVIFIVQENRSFDHYFGMYKNPNDLNVAGYPRTASGKIAKSNCNPHPVLKGCFMPYHVDGDRQVGGPHEHDASVHDVARGKMNGFIESAATSPNTRTCVLKPALSSCRPYVGPKLQPDVMGYMLRKDIPNYWALADYGVLMDHFFASVDSFSLPAHQFIFSGWSATCSAGPMTCKGDVSPAAGNFSWTPLPYLLDQHGVDWKWYVGEDTNVCANYPSCPQQQGDQFSPTNWNVAPGYTYVQDVSGLNTHVKPVSRFHQDLADGTLPAVSWIIPDEQHSEHPGKGSMRPGYDYASDLVKDIGASSSWSDTAIWLYWDDWGGFYDHMKPPRVDRLGYGIRVPGILISPYAKVGWVDHQRHSFDSFLKFIEDRWLSGERLDPDTMGRPDARPNVRENEPGLGDLSSEFDFTQSPRPAPVLPD